MKHITRYTDRTIRSDNSWVKITRDNKDRIFTFAKGDKGNTTAHHMDSLSFKWCWNWTEATERANRLMSSSI
jgi:hypothetical protein